MTLEEFIKSNPSKEKIAFQICGVANTNVLDIEDTFAWQPLSELGGYSREDFYDDQNETIERMGAEAITHHGIVNWKLKTK